MFCLTLPRGTHESKQKVNHVVSLWDIHVLAALQPPANAPGHTSTPCTWSIGPRASALDSSQNNRRQKAPQRFPEAQSEAEKKKENSIWNRSN